MGIGQRIREVREAQGMGLRELARRINITPGALSKLETDEKRSPEFNNVAKAAEELGVTLDFLAKGKAARCPRCGRDLGPPARQPR
jgi:transcriptional regulator with XRE-family HTH domain